MATVRARPGPGGRATSSGPGGGGQAGSSRPGAVAQGAESEPQPGRSQQSPELAPRNEVVLVGRVSGDPVERELPSGDRILTWRLVVDRPPVAGRPVAGRRAATVDTLDCVAWASAVRRAAARFSDGDVVAVEGALRRRFWRAGAGAASRCEVEAATARRLARPPRPG